MGRYLLFVLSIVFAGAGCGTGKPPIDPALMISAGGSAEGGNTPRPEIGSVSRKWTVTTEKTPITAKVVEVYPAEVLLQEPSGSRRKVAIGELGPEDRHFLATGNDTGNAPGSAQGTRKVIVIEGLDEVRPWTMPAEVKGDKDVEVFYTESEPAVAEKLPGLEGLESRVDALAISADGKYIAAIDEKGDCRVWETESGKQVGKLEGALSGRKFQLAISSDGQHVHVASKAGGLDTWNVASGKIVKERSELKPVIAVAAARNGSGIGFVETPSRLHFQTTLGEEDNSFNLELPKDLDLAAVSPDGLSMLVGYRQGNAAMLAVLVGGRDEFEHRYVTAPLLARSNAFALSKRFALIGTDAPICSLFDRNNWSERTPRIPALFAEPWASVDAVAIAPDESYLVTAHCDSGGVRVHFLDAINAPTSYSIECQHAESFCLGPDGRTVAAGFADGDIHVWRLTPTRSAAAEIEREIGNWRRSDDFAALEAKLEKLQALGDAGHYVPWSLGESPATTAFQLLLTSQSSPLDPPFDLDAFLKRWREARPDSAWCAAAEANRHIDLAWAARGGGLANTVTLEGRRAFREHLEAAQDLLTPLFADEKKPAPGVAYQAMFVVMMGQVAKDEDKGALAERLLRDRPRDMSAHTALLNACSQKWSGSRKMMQTHQRAASDKIGGLEGDGYFGMRFASNKEDWFFAMTHDDEIRSVRGLHYLSRRHPRDAYVLNLGLLNAGYCNAPEEMRRYAELLKPLGDPCIPSVWAVHPENVLGFKMFLDRARSPELGDGKTLP